MIQKTLFLCACFILAAFCPAFSQSSFLARSEDEVSNFGGFGIYGYPSAVSGVGGVYPLFVTEYQGTSFDSLARAKTVSYKDGKAEAETVFAADGSVLHSVSYAYTDAGLLSEISGADSSGALRWAYRYEYGEEGRLLREVSLIFLDGQEKAEGEVLFSYNGNGLLSKRETFSAEGALTLSEAFVYDESGRLTEKNSYYGDGTLLKRETCEYSKEESPDGNMPAGVAVRIRQYDSNGLYETSLFEYKGGRVSAVLRYGADSVLKDSEVLQYSDGKVSRRVRFNAEGAPVSESARLYDWAGNLVMERDGAGISVWEFVYPEQSFDGAF